MTIGPSNAIALLLLAAIVAPSAAQDVSQAPSPAPIPAPPAPISAPPPNSIIHVGVPIPIAANVAASSANATGDIANSLSVAVASGAAAAINQININNAINFNFASQQNAQPAESGLVPLKQNGTEWIKPKTVTSYYTY